ncbi:phage baseplate protein [Xenorhabdus koppenhoeferi]|uniref:phage baseplate protein n=1 Tax=Xenorhabdus koppenhoeferi TaxID=351659 RepID=UPI000B86A2E6
MEQAQKALPKSSIVQVTGNSAEQVMSQKAITDALANAVSIDMLYPIGIVVWFAQNKNPNSLFPNTSWKYIGENKTIRLATSTGSDLLLTGGSDSITLTTEQMPVHNHKFSGNTNNAGEHAHTRGTMNIVGNMVFREMVGGVPSTGAFTETRQIVERTHRSRGQGFTSTVNFEAAKMWTGTTSVNGVHNHSFNGTTNNIGESSAINIMNSYVMLMGWYRTA